MKLNDVLLLLSYDLFGPVSALIVKLLRKFSWGLCALVWAGLEKAVYPVYTYMILEDFFTSNHVILIYNQMENRNNLFDKSSVEIYRFLAKSSECY